MSDWEIVSDNKQSKSENNIRTSDWELTDTTPISQQKQPSESFSKSALLATPRVAEDIVRGGFNLYNQLPSYYESAKTEVPGALKTLYRHPAHALSQATAGLAEMGQNLFNTPHDIINYASNRLNLIPEDINKKVQMARMPDSTQAINQTFGQPMYKGEKLIRGIGRDLTNPLNVVGARSLSLINPARLSAKGIANDVLNTAETNKKMYGKHYNNLWKEAENKGLDDALYDVNIDMKTLKKFSPTRSIKGVVDFDENPTLQNAHNAKSDLLRIKRDLEKLPTLRTAERQQLKATNNAIDSIQSNMFKDSSGKIDTNLQNKYNLIQQGYANHVIPYKNKAINKYKRNEISAKELVNSLSKGEFAAKRGKYHPEIKIRNALQNHPYLASAGIGGLAGAAGTMGYKNIFGEGQSEQ